MFSLTRPTAARITAFLAAQDGATYSYDDIGATQGPPPAGYTIDHNRLHLGTGAATYDRAVAALRRWDMLALGWAAVHPPAATITPGRTVAVVVRHYGFWSLNACRIVYVLDDAAPDDAAPTDGVHRVGFAYGTLPAHGAVGEERFMVEWRQADDSVWYDLYALSRPGHPLARLGYPLARRLQRRFARASTQAMPLAAGSMLDDHRAA